MTDSKHEMEILSTSFDQEDDDNGLFKLQCTDKKIAQFANIILKLKKELNALEYGCKTNQFRETDICFIKKQLVIIEQKHCNAVTEVLELARLNNFDVENLEGLKIDINQYDIPTDMPVVLNDSNNELIDQKIVVNNGSKNNNKEVFIYDQNHETKLIENHNQSMCSVNNGQKNKACWDSEECRQTINKDRKKRNKKLDPKPDFEKEAIRDDILAMAGEMKILHKQNYDLLSKLDNSNQQTNVLSDQMNKKTDYMRCKPEDRICTGFPEIIEPEPKMQDLNVKNSKLCDVLKETESDRCQIESAKKTLNESESQCVNCMGTENKMKKLTKDFHELLTHYKNKLSEIEILQTKLDEEKYNNRALDDRLMISKAQVTQLEKQLFELNLAPSNNLEVVHQNDQYVIENLKHRLKEAKEENSNLQTMFDFHLTELEDKKSKYLAVLQANEEQKHDIEILSDQKRTIAKEYEVEFNRMNEHLQKRLGEIENLPAVLAATQKDLKNEILSKNSLEKYIEHLKEEIDTLKKSLPCEDNEITEKKRRDLEEENTQLKATIVTLNDCLDESQQRYVERSHYLVQLKEQLDVVREEAAIQVTKIKDVSEYQKLKYTDYIQTLEKKLANCRAVACAEFKKRDSVDERLRNQIEILTKSLNEAHRKIGEFQDTNKLIELKIEEELCKTPREAKSRCRDVNKHKDHVQKDK